jgi:hypothetical protein
MMERRFRLSAMLLLCGFAVELATLFSAHPAAFLVFAGAGGLFLAAGIGLYLLTLLQTLVPRRMSQ